GTLILPRRLQFFRLRFKSDLKLDRIALSFLGCFLAELSAQLAFFLLKFLTELGSHLQFDVAVERFIERKLIGTLWTGDFLVHIFLKQEAKGKGFLLILAPYDTG